MRKFLLLGLLAVSTLTGCVAPMNVSKVLQLPTGTKLYTTYNIWYEIPWNISSINYQKGKIIPFGTEIRIVSADPTNVSFEVVPTGRNYTITYYEKYGMKPVEDFIKQLVSTKNRSELTVGISADVRKKILMGRVEKGMTRNEVMLAYGPPSPHRTPLIEGTTWIYWVGRMTTIRIIFKDDKVIDILK